MVRRPSASLWPQGGSRPIRLSAVIATVIGLALAIYLIVAHNADAIGHAMLLVGWGLIPVSLYHLVPLGLSAFSWRDLYPRSHILGIGRMILLRFGHDGYGERVLNGVSWDLLPVAFWAGVAVIIGHLVYRALRRGSGKSGS